MSDYRTWTEADIEDEILARRVKEEKIDFREQIINTLVLVFLLILCVCVWIWWGSVGFKDPYDRINKFAIERTTSAKQQATPAKISTASNSTAHRASAPLSAVPDSASPGDIAATIGQAGDAYGGANALFSALVASLAAWAGYLQFKALKRAQQAYQDQRDENRREKYARKNEEKDRQLARFETHFFQLLDLVREARERIATTKTNPNREPKVGSAALDAFANTIFKEVTGNGGAQPATLAPPAARELTYHYQTIYNRRPSALGPYFRLLFQTFKFISKQDLDPAVKLQYAKIARGQMSDGSILLLALNGMSHEGHDFVEFIEEFGLLEHMLDKYLHAFSAPLNEAYRPRAFLGSDGRARSENTHDSNALFEAGKFHWTAEQLKEREELKKHNYFGVGDDTQD